jgi:hypothetical protein
MGCACNKGKGQQFEVVAAGDGKVLFTSSSKPTATAVSKRYPGSTVQEKGKAEPVKADAPADAAKA